MARNSSEEQDPNQDLPEEESRLSSKIDQTSDFVRRNQNILAYIGIGIALLIGGFLYYMDYQETQGKKAQQEMFQAVYYFENDSLNKALTGATTAQTTHKGFLDIVDEYSGTKAANLARFYIGNIYIQQGKYASAITHLKQFESGDILLQSRAYSLIGDAKMEQGKPGEAVAYYEKAANHKSNKEFTPRYLMKLATAHKEQQAYDKAATAYQQVIRQYPDSPLVSKAKKYKAYVSGLKDGK